MVGIGTNEILLIVILVISLFGAKQIPEITKGFGCGIKNFKNELKN